MSISYDIVIKRKGKYKRMKKIVLMLLVAALAVALLGCVNPNSQASVTPSASEAVTSPAATVSAEVSTEPSVSVEPSTEASTEASADVSPTDDADATDSAEVSPDASTSAQG
jgi:hypothetical protein